MFGPGVAGGVPNTRALPIVRGFEAIPSPGFYLQQYQLTGVTRDSTGAPLGSCAVKLFNTATDYNEQDGVSKASTGIYTFNVSDGATQYYVVAYLPGSPDVAGTTKNNLVGV